MLKTGENIQLGPIEEHVGETVGSYVHFTGKNAVVMVLRGGTTELAKDIAMHVSAMKPTYIQSSDISNSDIEAVIEVLK